MSVCTQVQLQQPLLDRKRTTSFSSPPRKRLHRTESYVDLSSFASTSNIASTSTSTVPYTRTLRFYKEQKERRRALLRREPPSLDPYTQHTTPLYSYSLATTTTSVLTSTPAPVTLTRRKPSPAPPPTPQRARTTPPSPLVSGPGKLAVTPPPTVRAPFPPSRGKSPPRSAKLVPPSPAPVSAKGKGKAAGSAADLHRRAVTACMRASPAGAKILHMGARLAVGIMSATRDLERMCGDDAPSDAPSSGFYLDEEDEDLDAEGVDEEDLMDEEEVLAAFSVETTHEGSWGRVIVPSSSSSASSATPTPTTTTTTTEDVPMPDAEPDFVPMPEPEPVAPVTLSASWIVVGGGGPGEEKQGQGQGDWEMVGLDG
ncbi:hypothetical protein C8R46DRAFT_511981 [Mycena filopes]|nr:hypothetical protein C8R46DRAFT_511981 [Mycena filopes]